MRLRKTLFPIDPNAYSLRPPDCAAVSPMAEKRGFALGGH
jgi:hypothetical protein